MATTSPAGKQTSKPATDAFTCPECGRTFTRAAALGAHRKLKHGVAGSRANAKANRATSRRAAQTAATRRGAASWAAANSSGQGVDRDALLAALFPSGIPPRQDVIVQVNAWLDEAERLARAR